MTRQQEVGREAINLPRNAHVVDVESPYAQEVPIWEVSDRALGESRATRHQFGLPDPSDAVAIGEITRLSQSIHSTGCPQPVELSPLTGPLPRPALHRLAGR
jgi:hypothetical protein